MHSVCYNTGPCFRTCLATIAVLLLAILRVCAQEEAKLSSLHGTVRDVSGAPVANVSLMLQPKGSPTSATTTTGSDGHYSFVGLSTGSYSLQATRKGYRTAEIPSVVITAGEAQT